MPATTTKTPNRAPAEAESHDRPPPPIARRDPSASPASPRLYWRNLATEGAFFAALVSGRFRPRTELHTHDFAELMYVLAGAAIHLVNDQRLFLRAGDLVFVRPDDRHDIVARDGAGLQYVNVAFPEGAWAAFRSLAQLNEPAWTGGSSLPPSVAVPAERREECERVFRRALFAFHEGAAPLELGAFLALSVPFLTRPVEPRPEDDGRTAPWLRTACWTMRDERNLRAGLARFVEISGVSRAHLSRSLRAAYGVTPTQFVNRLRVERAALLLATTTEAIGNIAVDCGFGTLSYFYRVFELRYGQSPRAYRLQAQRAIAP